MGTRLFVTADGALPPGPVPEGRARVSSAAQGAAANALFVVCGACRGVLRLSPAAAGRLGRCPSCQRAIQVPPAASDRGQRARVVRAGLVVASAMVGAACFVFGLSGVLVGLWSSAESTPAAWTYFLGGALALCAAVAAAFGSERAFARCASALALASLPALALGGAGGATPVLGLFALTLGASQAFTRVALEVEPERSPSLPSHLRTTSRPRLASPASA